MTAFINTFACQSRAHCATCRVDAAWRANVGAPDACPANVTASALPPLNPDALNQPPATHKRPAYTFDRLPANDRERAEKRLALCNRGPCPRFRTVCEEQFPQVSGKCADTRRRVSPAFGSWLAEVDASCPLKKW